MIGALALLLAAQATAPAPAAGGVEERLLICPTDGSPVETLLLPDEAPRGYRIDGKPLGIVAPAPLPVCGDGFPAWQTVFAEADVVRYRAIVASEAYREKTQAASPYYRLYWLHKLDSGRTADVDLWHLLQQASWEADRDPGRYRRLQEEMLAEIDAAAAAGRDTSRDRSFYATLMAANAERVLGRFAEAKARLATLNRARMGKDSRAAQDYQRLTDLIAANDRRIDPAGGRG